MKLADVVIIDTGIYREHVAFQNIKIDGIRFKYNQSKQIEKDLDYSDKVGHGTAVAGLILSSMKAINVFVCKVAEQENFIPEDILLAALSYIEKNIECPIINMSIGYTRTIYHKELYYQIMRMVEKGIVFVSAFDNMGAMSYPAAYDFVIGVDVSDKCHRLHDIVYIGGDAVTVCAKGNMLRVPSIMGTYVLVKGTSFATALVTKQILFFYLSKKIETWGVEQVKIFLERNSIEERKGPKFEEKERFNLKIKKAAVFPFGKEALNLALYADVLPFSIVDFFDYRSFGRVGRKIKKDFSTDYDFQFIVKNIDDIKWKEIDTLILCHVDKFVYQLNMENYVRNLIALALENNIQIFSFDNILSFLPIEKERSHFKIYWPEITKKLLPVNNMGKLFCLSTPVVGIFGTSSRQGKFALQMKLRKEFIERGYRVAQLGTEPYSELFGFDAVYPMGYNSAVELNGYESIYMLNYILHNMEVDGAELIIVGSQSGTVPFSQINMESLTQATIEFLFGTEPDAVILCVNPYDSCDYIKRTISFIQSAVNARVLAICLFPYTLRENGFTSINAKRKMNNEEIQNAISKLKYELELPVYNTLGGNMDSLCQKIINYF